MKKILGILILLLFLFSAKSQVPAPSGLPAPYSTGYYRIGWIQTDSGFINAVRDTSLRPKYMGTEIVWFHTGVDTAKWIWFGKWIKELKQGDANNGISLSSLSAVSPIVYNNTTGQFSCPSCGSGSGGIASLNALTSSSQTFATGTSGSDFNISSSVSVHTFNFPTASPSSRGLLGTADFAIFAAKQAQLNGTGFVRASGTTITYDNTVYYPNSNPGNFISLTAISALSPVLYNSSTGAISADTSTGLTHFATQAYVLAHQASGTLTGAGNLVPLFTTSVVSNTLVFTLSNAAANSILGNNTGSSAAPAYFVPTATTINNWLGYTSISRTSLSALSPLLYNSTTGVFSADTSAGRTHLTTQADLADSSLILRSLIASSGGLQSLYIGPVAPSGYTNLTYLLNDSTLNNRPIKLFAPLLGISNTDSTFDFKLDTTTSLTGLATKYQITLKQNLITLTTAGTGAATFNQGTGALNIPTPSGSSGANPTANIGLTAVNGSATTFMRSDAAPLLSQSITPIWTAAHTFNVSPFFNALRTATSGTILVHLTDSTAGQVGIGSGLAISGGNLTATGGGAITGQPYFPGGFNGSGAFGNHGIRILDVVHDFGADSTGATDATSAIQAAINAAMALGGAEIDFPDGTYLISGALNTSHGNSQLYVPNFNIFTTTLNNKIIFKANLGSMVPAGGYNPNLTASAIPTKGVIWKSTINGGSVSGVQPSVIKMDTSNNIPLNYTSIRMEGITIQLSSAGGTAPSKMTAFNLRNAGAGIELDHCVSAMDSVNQKTVDPTGSGGIGFFIGNYNNGGPIFLRGCQSNGTEYGYVIAGDHVYLENDYAFVHRYGWTFTKTGYVIHGKALAHGCIYSVFFPNTVLFPNVGVGQANFANFTFEEEQNYYFKPGTGTPYWYNHIASIVDTGNWARGRIDWIPIDSNGLSATIVHSSGQPGNADIYSIFDQYHQGNITIKNNGGILAGLGCCNTAGFKHIVPLASSYGQIQFLNDQSDAGLQLFYGGSTFAYANTGFLINNHSGGKIKLGTINFLDAFTMFDAGNIILGSNSNTYPSAVFAISSTTKASIPAPIMTTTQKNAISTPVEGDMVYDATLHGHFFYTGSVWSPVAGSGASGANPTASVGLTAVNGSATTYMRSDASPALSQSLTPTMTGKWIFNGGVGLNGTLAGSGTPNILVIGPDSLLRQMPYPSISGAGVTRLAPFDSLNNSATGATINSITLGNQSANLTVPGMVNTGRQLYEGAKYFYRLTNFRLGIQGDSASASNLNLLSNPSANGKVNFGTANTTFYNEGSDAFSARNIAISTSATGGTAQLTLKTTTAGTTTATVFQMSNDANDLFQQFMTSSTYTANAIFGTHAAGWYSGGTGGMAFWPNFGNLRFANNAGTAVFQMDGSTGNISMGTTLTNVASALLNLNSTQKGVLHPSMTTTQKNAISGPATGLMVYDATLNEHDFYNGSAWVPIGGGVNFYTTDGTLSSNRYVFTSTNHLNIGTDSIGATNPAVPYVVNLNGNFSNTTGNNDVLRVIANQNAATTGSLNAIDISATATNATGTNALLIGFHGAVGLSGAGTLTAGRGVDAGVIISSAGTLTTAIGIYTAPVKVVQNATGTVTNAYGIFIDSTQVGGGASTVTNRWGLFQLGATDKNQFNGQLNINGGLLLSQASAADANYTVGVESVVKLGTAITANRVITLPTPANFPGRILTITNYNTSAFVWTTSGTIIDGAGSGLNNLENGSITNIISDGTSWILRGVQYPVQQLVIPGGTIITSGTSSTLGNGFTNVFVNPSSVIATYTLTLPSNPTDGALLKIHFGGTLVGGAAVVTALTISPNSGQTIVQSATPTTGLAGNCFIYQYSNAFAAWYREQ